MNMLVTRKTKQVNEAGFASLVIALILIIVLALLTIGFAQLARREQRNALDKQLANQAYYAAETGFNDVSQMVHNAEKDPTGASPDLATLNAVKPNVCLGQPGSGLPASALHSVINQTDNVSYTCVLLDITPPDLTKNLNAGQVWNTVFTGVDDSTGASSDLASFTVSWQTQDGQNLPRAAANTYFEPTGNSGGQWGSSPAIIQFTIVPLSDTSRNGLTQHALTAFLYPSSAGSQTLNYAAAGPTAADQGQILTGGCTAATGCQITVNLASGVADRSGESYLMTAVAYQDTQTNMTIGNARNSSGGKVDFGGSAAQIDSTGKSLNALRRIQVQSPLANNPQLPAYALFGRSLCKRLIVDPSASPITSASLPGASPTGACDLS